MTGNSKSSTRAESGKMSPAAQCPICEGEAAQDYLPFCSQRCANVDLHRWLSGRYAIPAADEDSEDRPNDEKLQEH